MHSERSISVKQHNAQVHSLEKQLRDAKLQLAGTDKAVRAKAEEARIEIEYEWSRRQWAERQLAYYRRKLAKLRGGDQAALECRRSGTTALQEIGKVNHYSTVVAGEEHERKIDCQKALQALREQLSVLREVDPCEECEPCTEEDSVPYKE